MKGERLEIRLQESEKAEITGLARQARISVAEVIRRLVLGRKLPDTHLHEAVIELARINADLARLGNLLRMALTDEDDSILPQGFDLQELYEDIRRTQGILKDRIRELRQ